MNVSAIILTGGKNLRMGRNKSLEMVAGKTLLERVYERVRPLSDDVIIVTSLEFSQIPIQGDYSVVTDTFPQKGPLGGIYTGLMASQNDYSIVAGCDMPFINTALLKRMVEMVEGHDAVVPLLDDGMKEPLHAVYSTKCASLVEQRLKNDRLGVHRFIDSIDVLYIEKDEIMKYDPDLTTFFDINYPSDIERATVLASELDLV